MNLPNDKEVEQWFIDNIGINNDCSASSAIYKFRLWLKELNENQYSKLQQLLSEKEKENSELESDVDRLEIENHTFKTRLEYWKQRCEAAEKVIIRVNEDVYKLTEYHEWQSKQSPIN